jgi:hypothetical protein
MYEAVPGSRSKQPMSAIMPTVFETQHFCIMGFYPTQLLQIVQLVDSAGKENL